MLDYKVNKSINLKLNKIFNVIELANKDGLIINDNNFRIVNHYSKNFIYYFKIDNINDMDSGQNFQILSRDNIKNKHYELTDAGILTYEDWLPTLLEHYKIAKEYMGEKLNDYNNELKIQKIFKILKEVD